MTSRLPLLLLLVGGASLLIGVGQADAFKDNDRSETMEQYLTSVTKDVDAYWTQEFKDAGLPEPRVSYDWIPTGSTAAYSPEDDTIRISQEFATNIYDGALNQALPGSSQGYGKAVGDFAVAYIVAHEYGHQIQDELGEFDRYGDSVPTMNFELQADCYAGAWAKHAQDENKLEDGDVQEALDAALAVGDFSTDSPGHHGTPEQREASWKQGFDSGDPSACTLQST
jgi:uncharacterized protein